MPRWKFTDSHGKDVLLPTESNHYEGALFHTLRLPTSFWRNVMLFLGSFSTNKSFGGYVGEFEANSWLLQQIRGDGRGHQALFAQPWH
jgi:hypothetical protein